MFSGALPTADIGERYWHVAVGPIAASRIATGTFIRSPQAFPSGPSQAATIN